jgi:hypothetical protein
MLDFVQPHVAAWRFRRFGRQAGRDERQGHGAAIRGAGAVGVKSEQPSHVRFSDNPVGGVLQFTLP